MDRQLLFVMHFYDDVDLEIFPAGETYPVPVEFRILEEQSSEYMALAMGKYGALNFRITELSAYSIWHTRFYIHEKMRLRVTAAVACTFLWVAWKNDLHYSIYGTPEQKIRKGYYNLCHMPDINWEINFRRPGEYETFNVIFTETGLEEWMRTSTLPDLQVLRDKVNQGEIAFLHPNHHLLTIEVQTLIDNIVRGPHMSENRQTFYEEKALDLLFHVLRDITKRHSIPQTNLHPQEIKRLYKLRDTIAQYPGDQYQLKELAETAGMNESKLEAGFKQLFKTTVFGLILDERMRMGYRLLKESTWSVKEVAAKTGYKNTPSFTHAFTKYFGFPPSHVNRR